MTPGWATGPASIAATAGPRADEAIALAMFDTSVAADGHLIDTADVFIGGESERMLGRLRKTSGMRDRLVISTKAEFPRSRGHGRRTRAMAPT